MGPIVDAGWLQPRLGQVIVVHVGTTMAGPDPQGRYRERHLPGAGYLSLDDDLSAPPRPIDGRHPLPSPENFAAALGRVGVDDGSPVVAYDDGAGGHAARLVWMLRILGSDAALLDGGLAGWSGPTDSGPAADVRPVTRHAVPWPVDAIADADEVQRVLDSGGVVVDSRDPARYRGEHEPIDRVAGHVPGAINLPFADNLTTSGDDGGTEAPVGWRDPDQLRERFAPIAEAATNGDVIVYCGSGVTATHNALALEAAGFPLPRVYVGSWSGWSSDPDRPVATGDE